MSFRGQPLPEEYHFLCMLHNIGATSSDKSLTLEEISRRIAMKPEKVMEKLERLIREDYVDVNDCGGIKRYQVTVKGVMKVMSMYS